MLNHGDPVYECGDLLYRKRGNEIFAVPRWWESMKKSSSLAVRLKATWKKLHRGVDHIPDVVLEQFKAA
jgi:hypothetical protein